MDLEVEFMGRSRTPFLPHQRGPMRRIVLIAALAVAALVAQCSTALATCYSSTPATQSFPDVVGDGDSGLAPEITGVSAALDSSCSLSVDPMILGDTSPGDLISDENVGIYLNTDGNSATGSPTWNGADKVVITVGELGADLPPGLGTWTGTDFDFANAPALTPVDAAGFSASLDALGIAAPTTVGIRTISLWEGIFDNYADFAPEVSATSFGFPVTFSTTAPTPTPAPIQTPTPTTSSPASSTPTSPSPLVPTPSTAKSAKGSGSCVVPAVKGLSTSRALTRIRQAGCRSQTVRVPSKHKRGTVISQAPAAGKFTSNPVVLVVSRGRGHSRLAPTDAAALYSAVERSFEGRQGS